MRGLQPVTFVVAVFLLAPAPVTATSSGLGPATRTTAPESQLAELARSEEETGRQIAQKKQHKSSKKGQAPVRVRAQKHFDQGELKYKTGNFEGALADYTAAYEALPMPAILYNIGQCHRHLGDHEQAVFFYERYLKETPGAYNREDVETLVAESKVAVAERAEQERLAEEERRRQAELERKQRETELAQQKAKAETEAAAAAAAAAEEPIYGQWWFWTAVGGAAAVAAGATAITVAAVMAQEPETVAPYGSLGTLDTRGQ